MATKEWTIILLGKDGLVKAIRKEKLKREPRVGGIIKITKGGDAGRTFKVVKVDSEELEATYKLVK